MTRRSANAGVHDIESPRQLGEYFVAQRMILPYPRLGRQMTEHLTLLMIHASHTFSYLLFPVDNEWFVHIPLGSHLDRPTSTRLA
jgi:hypothetical protein